MWVKFFLSFFKMKRKKLSFTLKKNTFFSFTFKEDLYSTTNEKYVIFRHLSLSLEFYQPRNSHDFSNARFAHHIISKKL